MASNVPNGGLDEEMPPIASINVTPFVDVVLVLLVIFMVTAPMIMKEAIGIRLPKVATGEWKKVTTLAFAITKSGNVLLNGKLVEKAEVTEAVKNAVAKSSDTQAILSADREAMHGDLVKVIDWIKSAGLNRFAIQVEKNKDGS